MALVENAFASIVLTAQSFNPSIFTETWLGRNSILNVDSLEGTRVFSPEVVQFQTSEVRVLIIPSHMQVLFGIHGVSGDFEIQRRIPIRAVELLPHIPYQALGLNFDFYVIPPEGQDFLSYDRALLGTGDCQLLKEFSAVDARFGRYFSKDYENARLKLDIKPVIKPEPVKGGISNRDLIQFSFNFHHEVSGIDLPERWQRLKDYLGNWSSLKDYATRLLELGAKP